MIVVCCRADGLSLLNANQQTTWPDAIQTHLRKGCIDFGATLIYTSCRAHLAGRGAGGGGSVSGADGPTQLYDYLMQVLFDERQQSVPSAKLEPAEEVFVPAGWDSEEKVKKATTKLPANIQEAPFEDVVLKPDEHARKSLTASPEEGLEDVQSFLARAQQSLRQQGGPPTAAALAREKQEKLGVASAMKRTQFADEGEKKPRAQVQLPGAVPKPGGEGDLANFFQNLLTRGQAAPKPTGAKAPAGAAAVSAQPAAARPQTHPRKSKGSDPATLAATAAAMAEAAEDESSSTPVTPSVATTPAAVEKPATAAAPPAVTPAPAPKRDIKAELARLKEEKAAKAAGVSSIPLSPTAAAKPAAAETAASAAAPAVTPAPAPKRDIKAELARLKEEKAKAAAAAAGKPLPVSPATSPSSAAAGTSSVTAAAAAAATSPTASKPAGKNTTSDLKAELERLKAQSKAREEAKKAAAAAAGQG